MPANAGRKRLNINGALNAHDVTDVAIDEADRIDQESMKRLIVKLVDKNPFKDIYLFHDNARYYYAKELREWLFQNYPSVNQIFLPPYSPNLNLIERLWKFLKKYIINYDFYPTFKEFKHKVLNFFDDIEQCKQKLESLLTLNFHIA
jgi:transposase